MNSRKNLHDVFTTQQTDPLSTKPLPQNFYRLAAQVATILSSDLSIVQRDADPFIFYPGTVNVSRDVFEHLFPLANDSTRGPCSQPERGLTRFSIGETVQAYIVEVPESDNAAEINN